MEHSLAADAGFSGFGSRDLLVRLVRLRRTRRTLFRHGARNFNRSIHALLIPDVLWDSGSRLVLLLPSLSGGENSSRLTCWGFATACALNVLTKGLIGLVFPIATIGLYLLLTRNLRHLARLRILSSTVIFFALAAPWHILAAIRNPAQGQARGFLWFYFVNEHIMRFLNKRVPPGYDTVPLFLFWAMLVLWLVPWAVFLPQALREVPLRQLRSLDHRKRANLLSLVGARNPSVLQLLDPAGVLHYPRAAWRRIACRRVARSRICRRRGRIHPARRPSVVPGSDDHRHCCRDHRPDALLPHAPTPSWRRPGRFVEEEPSGLRFLSRPCARFHAASAGSFPRPTSRRMLIAAFRNNSQLRMRRKGQPVAGNAVLCLMMICLLTCVHISFVRFSPILSSHDLAMAIQKEYQPGDLIVIDGQYHEASTLNFYTHIPVRVLHEHSGNLSGTAQSFPMRLTFSRHRNLSLRSGLGQPAFLFGLIRKIQRNWRIYLISYWLAAAARQSSLTARRKGK